MTWYKIDDQYPEHPKFLNLSGNAEQLWHRALAYSSRNLTDGRIPSAALPRLTPQRYPAKAAAELVTAGLWHSFGDGWGIHGYDQYQRSRARVEADRQAATERARVARERRVTAKSRRDTPESLHPEMMSNGSGSEVEQEPNRSRTHREKIGNESGAQLSTTKEPLETLTKPSEDEETSRCDNGARHTYVTAQETETETETDTNTSVVTTSPPPVDVGSGSPTSRHTEVAAAIQHLATLELDQARTANARIDNSSTYRNGIVSRLTRERSAELHAIAHAHPHLKPADIARVAKGDLTGITTPANQSRYLTLVDTRPTPNACHDCSGRRTTADDEGTLTPCPTCTPEPA